MRISRVYCLALALVFLVADLQHADAGFDILDPNGKISIKWDVVEWTADGYRAIVTMYNQQLYRHIQAPGWIMGWTWSKKEVIWNIIGSETREQGDCSKWKSALPHCCKKTPEVIDLLPGVPYNQQTANCCRGGVLSSFMQDPATSVASYQIVVGNTGNTNITIQLPKNFTLMTPGPGYTCSKAAVVPKTKFLSADGRRTTEAFMTWNITCSYTQQLANKAPTCCVSFSAFYNETIVPCPSCACDCPKNSNATLPIPLANGVDTNNQRCINRHDPHLPTTLNATKNNPLSTPQDMLFCTNDMCPIKIHWHIKLNYQEYWRVKITITNRDISRNYTLWNLVAQHPNFQNFTESFSFSYRPLNGYGPTATVNNSAIFWGVKFYNDMLMQAGPNGNVQSEILFRKDSSFTLNNGWGFPSHLLFNGDECAMPTADQYPTLPSSSSGLRVAMTTLVSMLVFSVAFLL
ncbi:hypothetical protein M758_12G016900 [Ceratodon purpureus]|nr:hypothetical protein M758_12G016900 [Ceratodon purpureus]